MKNSSLQLKAFLPLLLLTFFFNACGTEETEDTSVPVNIDKSKFEWNWDDKGKLESKCGLSLNSENKTVTFSFSDLSNESISFELKSGNALDPSSFDSLAGANEGYPVRIDSFDSKGFIGIAKLKDEDGNLKETCDATPGLTEGVTGKITFTKKVVNSRSSYISGFFDYETKNNLAKTCRINGTFDCKVIE